MRTTSGLQAVIELKIGDKWSATVLKNTIRKQLVDKYMAPENSRAGCLLVTIIDRNKKWKHPNKKVLIDINGLENLLKEEVKQVEKEISIVSPIFLDIWILNLDHRL
ncbi:hypothetical protein MTZ49_13390 [Entomomonas sp. E2T0]|uniref:hypothetical protein n=1 Tax=Entomomonas sp. E2T0 TaxID=2930213 RepID=UPI0022282E59|nr:hypothetical protein [Entomomonas sp. E2T0]UYZ83579.1 hypothetical protein MTZ49_13390 [Entomomonas sp. E2T0]